MKNQSAAQIAEEFWLVHAIISFFLFRRTSWAHITMVELHPCPLTGEVRFQMLLNDKPWYMLREPEVGYLIDQDGLISKISASSILEVTSDQLNDVCTYLHQGNRSGLVLQVMCLMYLREITFLRFQ